MVFIFCGLTRKKAWSPCKRNSGWQAGLLVFWEHRGSCIHTGWSGYWRCHEQYAKSGLLLCPVRDKMSVNPDKERSPGGWKTLSQAFGMCFCNRSKKPCQKRTGLITFRFTDILSLWDRFPDIGWQLVPFEISACKQTAVIHYSKFMIRYSKF